MNGQAANSARSASSRQYQPAQAQTRMLSGSGHSAANHQTAKPKRHHVSGASAAWPSSSTLVPPPPPTMPSLSSLMAVPPPPVMLPYSYAGSVGASAGVSAANANLAPSYQPAYAARPAYHSPSARQYHPWSSYQQSSYSSVNNDNYGSLVVRAPIKKHRRRIIATR